MPVERNAHQRRDRAESFGSVADQYDRARPTYPDALFAELATGGGVDVLDVACGTGIASRLLAARGLHVLGVEVDAGMAAVARARGTDVEVSPFESWDDAGRRFDLLTCAQAWHWIDPEVGARKAVGLLRPGGRLALFWNIGEIASPLDEATDAIYEEVAPELIKRGRRQGEPATESVLSTLSAAGFVDVHVAKYPWEQTYARDEWLELLGTYSDHHLLPDEQRARLLAGVGAEIDRHGGTITARYDTSAVLARTPA